VFQNDPDNTNRAYAARCLGGYYSLPAPDAIDVLVKTASDVNEDKEVRLSAYGALIMLLKGSAFKKEADRFLYNYIDGATPAEFDWDWLLVDQQQFLRMRP
jgi:hypothetical protein